MWTREQIKTNAKAVMAKNYWMMVGVSAVYSILAGIFSSASSGASSYLVIVIGISIVGIIFNIFVGNPLEVGKDRFYMCSRLQQTPFGELFCAFRSGQGYYMNIVKTQFLRRLYTALWSLLFIIPGIIKSYEYYMVPYILAENPNISSARAFELSKMMTNGEKLNIFVLELSFLGWQLLGILACCIGNYFVTPYLEASFAELYEAMRAKVYDMGVTDENELCNFWR